MRKRRKTVKLNPSKGNVSKSKTALVRNDTGGRPAIVIQSSQIRALATQGLNLTQMPAVLGVGHATLERRFADPNVGEEFRRAYEEGKMLRDTMVIRTAHAVAINDRNPFMLAKLMVHIGYFKDEKTIRHQHDHRVFADLEALPIDEIELRVRELTIKVRNAAQLASSEREPLAEAIEGKEADATQQER